MYCEVCWKSTVKGSGKTKPLEQPCRREGCAGFLGKAIVVPEKAGVFNLGSAIWGGKTNGEGEIEVVELLEEEESIVVQD
jgi:hypothetical protein